MFQTDAIWRWIYLLNNTRFWNKTIFPMWLTLPVLKSMTKLFWKQFCRLGVSLAFTCSIWTFVNYPNFQPIWTAEVLKSQLIRAFFLTKQQVWEIERYICWTALVLISLNNTAWETWGTKRKISCLLWLQLISLHGQAASAADGTAGLRDT